MKKFAFAGLALLVASSALAQFPGGPGQFPGQRGGPDRGRDQGFGRGRGGFDRCGYDSRGRNFFNDLRDQIQDVITDAEDIQIVANGRFAGVEARSFNDERVVDAYLAVGSLLGQAKATLTMTQVDWNDRSRFGEASDRANVGKAVDNLERAARAIRENDQFKVYAAGRFGLGQRLDCDIQDLRKINDALREEWSRPGRPGPGQRAERGSAFVQISVASFLEVVIGPNGPRVGQADRDSFGRTRLIDGRISTSDRRNDAFRNVRNVVVTPRNPVSRINTSVTTDFRTGDIKIMFRNASGVPAATDTFDITWEFN